MDLKKPILEEVLKHFLGGENTSRMVSHLRGNKKANVINNLVPTGLIWFIRIASFGCLYIVGYLLYQGQYPPNTIIIFLVIPWLSLSLGSAILTASEEQITLKRNKFQGYEEAVSNLTTCCTEIFENRIKSDSMDGFIKEKINFIEMILKDYGIEGLLLEVDLTNTAPYAFNIVIIRDFIALDKLEEAKQVRIRWNANHMPSQTGK